MGAAVLVGALLGAVILTWIFAAPTGRTVLSMQDQLEAVGGAVDVAT